MARNSKAAEGISPMDSINMLFHKVTLSRRTAVLAAAFIFMMVGPGAWQMPVASAAEQGSGAAGPEKVLVIGATGRTGRLIVSELLSRKHEVRGLTRNVQRAREGNSSVEGVQGDLRKPSTFKNIVNGVDRIVFAAGSSSYLDPTNIPQKVEFEAVAALIDLGVATKVKHVTLMSSAGVGHADPQATEGFAGLLRWKSDAESYLRNSGLSYTIVRPSALTEEPGGRSGIALAQGDAVFANLIHTSRADVAKVIVETLFNPAAQRKTFEMYNGVTKDLDDWKPALEKLKQD